MRTMTQITHGGYKVPQLVEYFLVTCGMLAVEGGPIQWVTTHRIHHANTDQTGDPHTPRDGGWWVALLTFGEGWHNNHHAHPTAARHGFKWYEIDVNWWCICLLRLMGLARRIKSFNSTVTVWQLWSPPT